MEPDRSSRSLDSQQIARARRSSTPSDLFDKSLIQATAESIVDTWQSLLSRTENWADLYSSSKPKRPLQAGVLCSRGVQRALTPDMETMRQAAKAYSIEIYCQR